jgi:hypothetical protein
MFVPHWKHIASPLRDQQVIGIYRFVTMVYEYNCHNSGYYLSPCRLFKTQRFGDWAHVNRYHLKTETKSSLRNVVFSKRQDNG